MSLAQGKPRQNSMISENEMVTKNDTIVSLGIVSILITLVVHEPLQI